MDLARRLAERGRLTVAPNPLVGAVVVRDGEVVGGRRTIPAKAGERVEFRVRADVADEVHVHGYDDHFDLQPGEPRTVRFDADLEGVFEVELEAAGLEIAQLRVSPS